MKSNVIVPAVTVVPFPAASTTATVTTFSPSSASPVRRSRGTVYVQSNSFTAPSGHATAASPTVTTTFFVFGSRSSVVVNFTCPTTSGSVPFGLLCGPLSRPVTVTVGTVPSIARSPAPGACPGFPAASRHVADSAYAPRSPCFTAYVHVYVVPDTDGAPASAPHVDLTPPFDRLVHRHETVAVSPSRAAPLLHAQRHQPEINSRWRPNPLSRIGRSYRYVLNPALVPLHGGAGGFGSSPAAHNMPHRRLTRARADISVLSNAASRCCSSPARCTSSTTSLRS